MDDQTKALLRQAAALLLHGARTVAAFPNNGDYMMIAARCVPFIPRWLLYSHDRIRFKALIDALEATQRDIGHSGPLNTREDIRAACLKIRTSILKEIESCNQTPPTT